MNGGLGKNCAFGNYSGDAITTGGSNNCFGYQAGSAITTGSNNCAFGTQALKSTTTSDFNCAFGQEALEASTTGSTNVAMGYNALTALTTGSSNVAIGNECMAAADVTGAHNTAVGRRAGYNISDGQENVCIGQYSASYITPLTTGDYNVYIGSYCQASNANSQKEIMIGYNTAGAGDGTFKVRAPSGSYNTANNANWNTTSDRRIKKSIVNNDSGLDKLKQIQVRNFEYKTEDEIKTDNPELTDVVKSAAVDEQGLQLGVIAQELETILPECVTESSLGIKTVNSDNLTWYLVNAVKELSAKNDALAAEVEQLKSQLNN